MTYALVKSVEILSLNPETCVYMLSCLVLKEVNFTFHENIVFSIFLSYAILFLSG